MVVDLLELVELLLLRDGGELLGKEGSDVTSTPTGGFTCMGRSSIDSSSSPVTALIRELPDTEALFLVDLLTGDLRMLLRLREDVGVDKTDKPKGVLLVLGREGGFWPSGVSAPWLLRDFFVEVVTLVSASGERFRFLLFFEEELMLSFSQ